MNLFLRFKNVGIGILFIAFLMNLRYLFHHVAKLANFLFSLHNFCVNSSFCFLLNMFCLQHIDTFEWNQAYSSLFKLPYCFFSDISCVVLLFYLNIFLFYKVNTGYLNTHLRRSNRVEIIFISSR